MTGWWAGRPRSWGVPQTGVHVVGNGEVGVSDVALWRDLAYHWGKAGVLRIGDLVQDHGHHDGLAGASVSQIRVSISARLAEQ